MATTVTSKGQVAIPKPALSSLFSHRGVDNARKREIDRRVRRIFSRKKKGLQLALEPLNGRGIAGYVPKP
jgi:hypothetical protein